MTSSKSQPRRLSQLFTFLITPEGEKSPVLHSVPEEPHHPAPSVPDAVTAPQTPALELAPKAGVEQVSELKVSSTTRRLRRLSTAFPLSIVTNQDSKPSKDESQNTLQKPSPAQRPATSNGLPPRTSSLPIDPETPNRLKKSPSRGTLKAQPSPSAETPPPVPQGRLGGLAPPSMVEGGAPPTTRPLSHLSVDSPDGDARSRKRMSWLPGSRSRQSSTEHKSASSGPAAWMIAGTSKIDYNTSALENAEQVSHIPQFRGRRNLVLTCKYLLSECQNFARVSSAIGYYKASLIRCISQDMKADCLL